MLPSDEAERGGCRSTEQRARFAQITANPSRGAVHAGRSTNPRAAHSRRALAEGQTTDSTQLVRPVAKTLLRCRGGDGISGRVVALDHRYRDIIDRRTARGGIAAVGVEGSGSIAGSRSG